MPGQRNKISSRHVSRVYYEGRVGCERKRGGASLFAFGRGSERGGEGEKEEHSVNHYPRVSREAKEASFEAGPRLLCPEFQGLGLQFGESRAKGE